METHSYQKLDPNMLLMINNDLQPLIDQLMDVVNNSNYSYKQKETALHVVNEVLFHKLVTDLDD